MKQFNDDPRRQQAESLLRDMMADLQGKLPGDYVCCGCECTPKGVRWGLYDSYSWNYAGTPDEAMLTALGPAERAKAAVEAKRAELRELEQKAGLPLSMTPEELRATFRGNDQLPEQPQPATA